MRWCQMSGPWCWCPGNVWTSALESEECLHAARVGAGVGIIRLRLRSTPVSAVSRDPSTEHRVQQPGARALSTPRLLSTPSWSQIDLRETANMYSVDKYVILFCSKKKTNLMRLYWSRMFKRIWTSNVYWGYFKYEEWKLWDISIHCNVFILPLLLQFNFNNPSTNIQEQHHIKWD